jgi:hypothetical protein
MFLAFPILLEKIGFWWAMGTSVMITVVCFIAFSLVVRQFGIELW